MGGSDFSLVQDGDAFITLLEDNRGASGAIGLEGALSDGGGELELDAGLAGGMGGER